MKVFVEEQRFDQWWFRLLMLLVTIIIFGSIVAAYPELKSDPSAFWTVLTASCITLVIIIIMLFFVKLKTKIDELGIHYAFHPVNLKLKSISWSEITILRNKKVLSFKRLRRLGIQNGAF